MEGEFDMSNQSVRIAGVTKKYGSFTAVDDISLTVEPGEFFTLLGPSGCGKTTLLRMIAGFNDINGGDIYFVEKRINDVPAYQRNIGMVFQNYAIFPHLSVRENVAYGLKARKLPKREIAERVDEAMRLTQIEMHADKQPEQLSGGQQQRVALARAIVIRPSLLLMDEPLSNLDAKLRVQMRSSVRKLQKSLGITTIYVTHDQEEALAISDRIAVMNAGRIMQVGSPYELYVRPKNRFVAGFLGNTTFLDGVSDGGGVKVFGKYPVDRALTRDYRGGILVAVRPEKVRFAAEGIPGEVLTETFLGDYINYEVKLEDGTVMEVNEYMVQNLAYQGVGTKVHVAFDGAGVNIFTADGEEALT